MIATRQMNTPDGRILCCNGKLFDVTNPSYEDLDLSVIAHCLSKNDRATGNYNRRWSLADHSVLASVLAMYYSREDGLDNRQCRLNAIAGLVHDGSEAYLVDLPRPIKYMAGFERYREIESVLQEMIYRKFVPGGFDVDIVKQADDAALKFEFYSWLNGARELGWLQDGYDEKAMDFAKFMMNEAYFADDGIGIGWKDSKNMFLMWDAVLNMAVKEGVIHDRG